MDFLDVKSMSEEDVKKFEGIDEAFGKAVSEYLKGAVDVAEFKKSLDGLKDSMEEFKTENASKSVDRKTFDEKMNAIEESIVRMKGSFENTGKGGELKVKSLEDQVTVQLKEFLKTEGGVETIDMREACKGAPGFKKTINVILERKAAVVSTGVATSFGDNLDTTLSVEPRSVTVIRQVANVASMSGRSVTYAEFKPGTGDAKWVPEGGLKPSMNATLGEKTINAGKIALTVKLTEETLRDIPSLVAEVRSEIINRIAISEELGILEGTGADGQIKGVLSDMPAFSLTGLDIERANMYDAIVAGYTQIISTSNMAYRPNLVLMNPIDYAKMQLTKDLNGQYLRPFRTGDELIPGLRVESSTAVGLGKFRIGDFSYLNIRDLVGLTITFGWENDDFTKNMVTMIGEKRLLVYIKSQYKTAFVADDFKTVIEAIAPETTTGS